MSLNILQGKSMPLAPTTSVVPTQQPATQTGFKNLLDQAMKRNSPNSQTKLPQGPTKSNVQRPEPRAKSSHKAISPQNPAIPALVANSASNAPPAPAQGQMPDTDHAIPNQSQETGSQAPSLELLAAGQYQPDPAETQLAGGKGSNPGIAKSLPQLSNQEAQKPESPPAGRKGQSKNSPNASASPASPAPDLEPASVAARALLQPENTEVRTPTGLLNAQRPATQESAMPAEIAVPIPQSSDSPSLATTLVQAPPPFEGSTQDQPSPVPGKDFAKLVNATENLQLNVVSSTVAQSEAPRPSHLQGGKVSAPHKTDKDPSADSAAGVRQKQTAVNLQTGGKDAAVSTAPATHDAGNILPPNTATAGSPGGSSKDGTSGQNSSGKHAEVPGSPVPGTSSSSANFSSAAASATAGSASGLAAAPSPPVPANATPAGAGVLPQPAATHSAAAAKLAAAADNPLNPAGGLVNSASMLRAQGKTEMRVALRTDNLGPVELHAVLDSGHVGASIAVVNHEAHTLLTNNLPALQQALTDQNLRLDHLSVLNTPMSTGTNTGTGEGSHSGAHAQPRPNTPRWTFSRSLQTTRSGKESSVAVELRGRLSVHA